MKRPKRTTLFLSTVAGIFALRAIKLAYQRSRLGQMVESIVGGQDQAVELNQALIDKLPRTSLSFSGKPAEPINIMILGTQAQIETAFRLGSWQQAVPIRASNWAKAFWAGLRGSSYPNGPMTPFYIFTSPHDLGFQRETDTQSFNQRHHIRLWQTNLRLAGGVEIWLGSASFDRSLRLFRGIGMPFHHIDPDLDAERLVIVKLLEAAGGRQVKRFRMTAKLEGRNVFHDRYFTDGAIVVVDLAKLKS